MSAGRDAGRRGTAGVARTGITQLSAWAVQDNVACADFDGDGTIDIDDLTAIANRWGQTSSTPGWDGRFDLRPDGRIDIVDVTLATTQWGQGCTLFYSQLIRNSNPEEPVDS